MYTKIIYGIHIHASDYTTLHNDTVLVYSLPTAV